MYPTPVSVRALYPSILLAAGVATFRLHEAAAVTVPAGPARKTQHRLFLRRMAALVTGHTKSMRDAIDAGVFAELASMESAMKVETR